MARFKRNKTWWTDFSINGQRFRQSLQTTDWREAQQREKDLITQASTGKLAAAGQQFARLPFGEAARRYLANRGLELSLGSLKKERQLLVQPSRFFGATSLARITTENLLAYREWRAKAGAGPAYLNMEMGAIRRILKRAKRWHSIAEDIRPLKERREIGRALSPEEKIRLLRVAESRSEWQVARCAIILALNTTMRGCELKGLQWRDMNLLDMLLTVRHSKTVAGERVLPLNNDAMAAILEQYKRAQAFSAGGLDDYVFPACENGKIDPTCPQRTWRTAWRRITREAGLPGLRFHDLRHHAITELAESSSSDQTIMAIAGHVSPKMLAHYSHIRLAAKRKALDALCAGASEAGYDTNNVTTAVKEPESDAQVIG